MEHNFGNMAFMRLLLRELRRSSFTRDDDIDLALARHDQPFVARQPQLLLPGKPRAYPVPCTEIDKEHE